MKKLQLAKILLQGMTDLFYSISASVNEEFGLIHVTNNNKKKCNKTGMFSLTSMSSLELPCRHAFFSSRRTCTECSSAFLSSCWSSCQMLMSFGHCKPGAELNWWHKGERPHIPLPKPHIPLLISCAIWPTNNINFLTLAIIILHKNVKSVGMKMVSCYWLFSSLLI